MTYYVVLMMMLLLCLYLGRVLGLFVLCDNLIGYESVKKYVYLVPFLEIAMLFSFSHECIKDRNWKLLLFYLRFEGKDIVILTVLSESLSTIEKLTPKTKAHRFKKPIRLNYAKPNIVLLRKMHELLACRFMLM